MKDNRGITLISLLITVIIMVILAGVIISSNFDYGLIEKFKSITIKYSDSAKEEKDNVGELLEYFEITTLKYSIAKKVKVGDYVSYIPDGTIPEDLPFNLSRQNINWRVLKNDGINVTLISEKPIDKIQLVGIEDWKNGINKIDTTYAGLYSGSKGTARNLNEDDINGIMGFDRDDETNWSFSDLEFKYQRIPEGIRTVGELEKYAIKNNLGIDITQDYTPDGRNLDEYEPDYYYYTGHEYKNSNNSIQCNLMFGENRGSFEAYWITSRCVWVNFSDNCVNYCMGLMLDGYIDPKWLYDSYHSVNEPTYAGRPIVVLNNNVEIDTDKDGDGSSPDKAWQLK